MQYKRNQIEEAVSRLTEPSAPKPSSELRTRLKRLLDTDRALGRTKGYSDFAFYSKKQPGRGAEVWFSEYEAFALLTGLRLMKHSWPQSFVVDVLRRVRLDLEKHHARVLSQDPAVLFDQSLIMQQARPGDLVVSNTDPVFLAISSAGLEADSDQLLVLVCRGPQELTTLMRKHGPGRTWTLFELATLMHSLCSELAKTRPSKRGRTSE